MRRIIVIPLILLLMAGLGLVGATSAPASVLCKVNETPCSAANVIKTGAEFNEYGQVSFGSKYVCKVGGMLGSVTDAGDEGKVAKAQANGLFGCEQNSPAASCGLLFPNAPYDMEFEGSEGNGTMVLSDSVELSFKVQCSFPGQTCTFTTKEKVSYSFTGGTPAVMTATNVPVSSGEECPTTMSMELKTGSATTPQSVFIVGGPAPLPRLCEVNTSPCPEGNRYPIGTALEGALEGDSVFEFLYEGLPREPWCESATLTGKTTQASIPLIGEVSALSFKKCGGGVCAVQAQSLPYKAEIEKTTSGNGTMALVSGGSGAPKIEINCGKAFKCIYKATSVSFAITGGNPAKIGVAKTLEKDAASEAECGSTMVWTATYQLTKPAPLFVT